MKEFEEEKKLGVEEGTPPEVEDFLDLRPRKLSEYIGQRQVVETLEIAIQAATKRGEPLDHILFHSPPGLGKTTLAHIIATEMGVRIITSSGPAIEKGGDLISILTHLERGDILFIDEVHRLPKIVEEFLYPAMEDFCIDFIFDKGAHARSHRYRLERFTLVGATTRAGLLSAPLRERFGRNRHNIGFMAVDQIARRHGFAPWRRRFQGETSEGSLDGERVILLRPATFMNESGRAVQEAANFFKLGAGEVTVFQDELELPPAKVRVKVGGGIAGHNGLRSISSHIGNDYRRVRLGIGHPGIKELVHGHVLSDFAKADMPWVEALCEAVADNAALLATGRNSTFQNKVHLALQGKGFLDKADDGAA